MPQVILDAHIHLWPSSAANEASHSWMVPGGHLTKQYSLGDYLEAVAPAASDFTHSGFVYVETDRTVGSKVTDDLTVQAAEPLKEIEFLRSIVEGTAEDGHAFRAQDATLLRGIVAWAPLNRPLPDFLRYMEIARETAGEATWSKIKGFRFLLQGIVNEDEFKQLVDPSESSFVTLLKFLGSQNLSFDVGVDQRQGGVWQLERFAAVIELAHKDVATENKTIFILNHLCKPDMEQPPTTDARTNQNFERWKIAISRMAKQERVYMKLSGAFSEIADQTTESPMPVSEVVERMKPWLDQVFAEFGPRRIMFGSDWPVCNVRGPGDSKSWSHWVKVVDQVLRSRRLLDDEMNRVWHGTAEEAYRLN
ncbi:uncharacterized protein PV09_00858 [Verruconis gallopava]|uniref:Amidohydrolase-related domain-containing protein n=1 Tax=Verruconis gallopava TaxID=253628 RepID=A0A0D2BC60_9PEZI|nr:uncharacterized protein PV09_00858 [Verruconis gallopava]KIW08944.1 hypothetical protein PV09_00858 [Verruconis gallopava]